MIHGTRAWAARSNGSELYKRVAGPVLLDRLALEVLAGGAAARVGVAAGGVLVDVVAEEHEGVEVVLISATSR